jgi:nucleoside-diphosphate-sugar epimerase
LRVLVFGATGFAGRYLVDELLRRGREVVGAARSVDAPAEVRHPIAIDRIALHRCDVTDPDDVRGVLDATRPDAAVLLSGVASPPLANRDPRAA